VSRETIFDEVMRDQIFDEVMRVGVLIKLWEIKNFRWSYERSKLRKNVKGYIWKQSYESWKFLKSQGVSIENLMINGLVNDIPLENRLS